jgi:Ca2+/Na+ antiporter
VSQKVVLLVVFSLPWYSIATRSAVVVALLFLFRGGGEWAQKKQRNRVLGVERAEEVSQSKQRNTKEPLSHSHTLSKAYLVFLFATTLLLLFLIMLTTQIVE